MPSADGDLEVALPKDYDRNRPAYKSRYLLVWLATARLITRYEMGS